MLYLSLTRNCYRWLRWYVLLLMLLSTFGFPSDKRKHLFRSVRLSLSSTQQLIVDICQTQDLHFVIFHFIQCHVQCSCNCVVSFHVAYPMIAFDNMNIRSWSENKYTFVILNVPSTFVFVFAFSFRYVHALYAVFFVHSHSLSLWSFVFNSFFSTFHSVSLLFCWCIS